MKIINWQVSPNKKKKYRVLIKDGERLYTVDFGARGYEQFHDSSPLKAFSDFNHNDPDRRDRYYKRHKIDYPPYTPDWLSKRFLW